MDYDKLYEDAAEHGRSWAVMHSTNKWEAYEELYGETRAELEGSDYDSEVEDE